MSHYLQVIEAPTVLKPEPIQFSELEAEDCYRISSTSATDDKPWSLAFFREESVGNHVRFKLNAPLGGKTIWWAYCPHVLILGTEDGNNPQDDKPPLALGGEVIEIAGIGRVGLNGPIYSQETEDGLFRSNFTWSEATKGGTRLPVDSDISERIILTAKRMDRIREYLGDIPLIVTSWYRPPHVNQAVGGASQSRHLIGDGVDFWSPRMSVVEIFKRLKSFHKKGGLAVGRSFVHVDWRGYASRWSYPGGPRVALW